MDREPSQISGTLVGGGGADCERRKDMEADRREEGGENGRDKEKKARAQGGYGER